MRKANYMNYRKDSARYLCTRRVRSATMRWSTVYYGGASWSYSWNAVRTISARDASKVISFRFLVSRFGNGSGNGTNSRSSNSNTREESSHAANDGNCRAYR